MRKNQLDVYGKRVRRKKAEFHITKSDLDPILEIMTQERDMSKWPVAKLLDQTVKLFNDKWKAIKPEIVESLLEALSMFQTVQNDDELMWTFGKICRKYKKLYEFFLQDSSNLLHQFFRIVSFVHSIVLLIKDIDSEREDRMSRIDYGDPKDGGEWYRVYDEVVNQIISDITFMIVDDQIRSFSLYGGKDTNIPLKLGESLPDALKSLSQY